MLCVTFNPNKRFTRELLTKIFCGKILEDKRAEGGNAAAVDTSLLTIRIQ